MSQQHLRRIERLEQSQYSGQRLRVVEWWPDEPRPAAEPGELLVILRRMTPRVPAADGGEACAESFQAACGSWRS